MKKPDKGMLKNRVWEIDALRGFMISCVIYSHIYYCVRAFCINGYYQSFDTIAFLRWFDPLHSMFSWDATGRVLDGFFVEATIPILSRCYVDAFFVLSGISCAFSRNNLKRAIKMLAGGFLVAAFTFYLWQWTGDPTRFIRFGALMCYACCQLIYVYFFEKRSNKTLLFAVIPIFIIGYFLRDHGIAINSPLLYPFGVGQIGDSSSDWWPILPMLGWFLIGVVIGRKYYSEKRLRLEITNAERLTRPYQFLGRHSGEIYIGHMVFLTAVFCGVGYLFGLL